MRSVGAPTSRMLQVGDPFRHVCDLHGTYMQAQMQPRINYTYGYHTT
jgi:hypothetical protein